jgi:mono/diheme cytochrome c family protein
MIMNLGLRYGTRQAVFAHVGIAALCASMAVACSGTIDTQGTQRSAPVAATGAGGAPPVAANNARAGAPAVVSPAPGNAPAAQPPAAPVIQEEDDAEEPEAPAAGGALSFESDVWPIFNGQCGSCHVTGGSGDQNIGSEDLEVALEDALRLEAAVISTIESGAMPLGCGNPPGGGGNCVSEEDFALIQEWYEQGGEP